MERVLRLGVAWLLVLSVVGAGVFPAAGAAKIAPPGKPMVQVAILLDTSGSMEGLIEQAKTELWKIVNEFATAKKGGQPPEFQVALYEYGKDTIPASEGYLRMILPLTTDLDKLSEELFVLRTNGGSEYCGLVIQSAARSLAWSNSSQDYRVIFIAGNEPFTQGGVDYRKSCADAIGKGIIINTIFCGDYNEGINTNWKDGADLADGRYFNIDHNSSTVQIDAPQDKEIARLGAELNKTYLAYGAGGAESAQRQAQQDKNARVLAASVAAERTAAKVSANYRNASWDLVDAVKEGKVKVDEVKEDELPPEMRKMSAAERKKYVEEKMQEREGIQQTINRLNEQRKEYLAAEMKKLSQDKSGTFGSAVVKAVREQAGKRNFKFE